MRIIICCIIIVAFSACVMPVSREEQIIRGRRVEALITEGVLLIREGSVQSLHRAWGNFSLAQELAPAEPRVYDGLGSVAWYQERYQDAEELFNQALSYDQFYSRAYVHLALIKERNGEYEAAKELLEQAISLDPLCYRARNNYAGLLYDQRKDSQSRRESYAEILKATQLAEQQQLIIEQNLEIISKGR